MTESNPPSLTELQGRFNALSKQRDDALNQTVLLSGAVEALTKQRDEALKEVDAAHRDIVHLQENITTLNSQMASLNSLVAALQQQLDIEKAVPRVTSVSS